MRTCANCNESIVEGYLLEDLGVTFCSNDCLDKVFPGSSTELMSMTDEEFEDSRWYWTSWEEDNGPGEPGECPRCFEKLADGGVPSRNSICRIDNQTVLCNNCGTEQAFKEWIYVSPENQDPRSLPHLAELEDFDTDDEEDDDVSESSSILYEDIVRVAEGRPDVNKYHYEDYADGTFYEDGDEN